MIEKKIQEQVKAETSPEDTAAAAESVKNALEQLAASNPNITTTNVDKNAVTTEISKFTKRNVTESPCRWPIDIKL